MVLFVFTRIQHLCFPDLSDVGSFCWYFCLALYFVSFGVYLVVCRVEGCVAAANYFGDALWYSELKVYVWCCSEQVLVGSGVVIHVEFYHVLGFRFDYVTPKGMF